jgi:protein TonB
MSNLLKPEKMKTLQTSTAQMDDIVFEKRNKSYGAYILRKTYNKQLNRALLIATAILIAGLAYPVVSGYNLTNTGKHFIPDGGVVFEQPPDAKDDVTPPPPPPPPISEKTRNMVFVAPIVVDGEDIDDTGFLPMEEFNNAPISPLVDVTSEKPAEKPDVVIENPDTEPPILIVQEMPIFPGGDGERIKYLRDNINYPKQAAETGIQGTVYVQFIVNSKGNITDAKILRGIGGGCDEEALRVVNAMPQWHPGKQNGKPARVLYNMAINFKLQS